MNKERGIQKQTLPFAFSGCSTFHGYMLVCLVHNDSCRLKKSGEAWTGKIIIRCYMNAIEYD